MEKLQKTASAKWEILTTKAVNSVRLRPELRIGQALMNCLFDMDESAYYSISESEYDPFYDNGILADFRHALLRIWSDK